MPTRLISTDHDYQSVSKIKNLPQATANGEAVTFEQLNAVAEGRSWKDSVRAASTVNLTLSAPGATIDGIVLTSGDRILVKNQATLSQNGIYIWNGASTDATRSLDANTFRELECAIVQVEEGTANASTTWRQTAVNGTLGSSDVIWGVFLSDVPEASTAVAGKIEIATQAEVDSGTDSNRATTAETIFNASWRVQKYADDFGDGSSTSYTINHNLGTKDVTVAVYSNATGSEPEVEVVHSTVNAVVIGMAPAPAVDAMRVVVTG